MMTTNRVVLITILVFVMFLVAKCSHTVYSGIANFPDYATSDALTKKYPKLIADLDEKIALGTSFFNIGAELETISYPLETMSVVLEKEEADDVVIKYGDLADVRSRVLINGFGHGRLGEQEVVIITRPVDKFGIDDVAVYLKYEP